MENLTCTLMMVSAKIPTTPLMVSLFCILHYELFLIYPGCRGLCFQNFGKLEVKNTRQPLLHPCLDW